jgi:AcrR family transcriptional regulator
MGKQAISKVGAGRARTDVGTAVEELSRVAKLGSVGPPKREKILVGILEEVGASGYDATSVRTVLDRTGLYRQAFYDNFGDKDACYQAAFEAGIAQLEALATAAAAGESGWRGKFRAGLGAVLEFVDAEPDIGRALVVEVHAAGPQPLARRAETMKKATDFIDLARHEPEGLESAPSIASDGIVAGIHAIVHSRLSTRANDGFRELLPEFMYFAVLPYFGAEAARKEMQVAHSALEDDQP